MSHLHLAILTVMWPCEHESFLLLHSGHTNRLEPAVNGSCGRIGPANRQCLRLATTERRPSAASCAATHSHHLDRGTHDATKGEDILMRDCWWARLPAASAWAHGCVVEPRG